MSNPPETHIALTHPCIVTIQDTSRPRSPPSAAIKLTRSHLKKQTEVEIEPKSLVDGLGQEAEEVQIMKEETLQDIDTAGETNELVDQTVKSEPQSTPDRPSSPPLSAVPNVIARLRNDTPGKRSTSNKENVEPEEAMATPQALNYDELENAVVSVNNTPSRSPQPTPRPEDHIVALDVLNDAVENVSKDIPEVQTSPEKPKKAATPPKKAAPIVRTTKASAARISMAQSKNASSNDPALGRPRQSMALSRASSVRETSSRPAPASKRVISTSSTKEEKASDGEKKEVVIPHSKPRPISMSFPTPPPPPKSTKAPTQSSFQLPGEAVAAKLRAAREARQQKETFEEEKRPAFKARPAPSALSKAPAVRQTNASKARESVMNGKEFKMPTTAASALGAAHRRANSVATTRPSAAATSRVVSSGTTSSRLAALGEKPSARPRPSTSMANISKPRMSTSSTTTTSAQRVPSGSVSGKGTSKGKEVFNRAANAKATADKEKHEREEANKKARAEAAERSRQMSREFAEKQRAKKRAAAGKQGPVEGAAAAVTA